MTLTSLRERANHLYAKYGWKRLAFAALAILVLFYFFTRGENVQMTTQVIERGPFVQEVSASGKVVAAQTVDLGFPQGGRISHVYAKAGSRVGAGATLAEIENGELRSLVVQREASVASEESQLKKLLVGTRVEEIAVAEADVTSSESALEQARRALRDEIEDAYRAADDAVRNTTDAFISNPRSPSPQLMIGEIPQQLKNDIEALRNQMEGILNVWGVEVAALSLTTDLTAAVSAAQTRASKIVSYLTTVNSALNRATPTNYITQATINAYIATVGSARSDVSVSIAALTTAQSVERSAAAALVSDQRALALKKAGATAEDIATQQAEIRVAMASLDDARAQLRRTIISAPFSGTVTAVDAKVGSIVAANTNAVSMISNGTFQIESYIPEINISYIQVGHTAVITLDAYGEDVPFTATVVSIDPAETVRDGVSTYRALLQFDTADERIRSGMTANIVIKTREKADVLAVPRGIVKERDGKKYVTVQTGKDETEEREVTTGEISSAGTIEILSGLVVGERVIVSVK